MASPLMFSFKTPGILAWATVRDNGDMKANSGLEGASNRVKFMLKFVDFQVPSSRLALARVQHGANIRIINGNLEKKYQFMEEADALITDHQKIFIAVTFADCPSVFLAGQKETGKPVVGIVHSGYKGTALNIAPGAINVMKENKRVDEKTLEAVIGPAICGKHYEFEKNKAAELFSDYPDQIKEIAGTGKCHLDLPGIIRLQLIGAGVPSERITISPYCTWSENSFLFSARREKMIPNDPTNPIRASMALIGISGNPTI